MARLSFLTRLLLQGQHDKELKTQDSGGQTTTPPERSPSAGATGKSGRNCQSSASQLRITRLVDWSSPTPIEQRLQRRLRTEGSDRRGMKPSRDDSERPVTEGAIQTMRDFWPKDRFTRLRQAYDFGRPLADLTCHEAVKAAGNDREGEELKCKKRGW